MRAIIISSCRPWPFIVAVCLIVVASLIPVSNAQGQEAVEKRPRPVVLVPPFENQSKMHENISYEVAGNKENQPKRRYTVDRYTEAPRSLFEDMLVNLEGVTIVERQRIDTLLVESEFGRLSGLVDQEKALKLGKRLSHKSVQAADR